MIHSNLTLIMVEFEWSLSGINEVVQRRMNGIQYQAIYLTWTRTRGSNHVITLIFGVAWSVLSLFERFASQILIRVFREDGRGKIEKPADNGIFDLKLSFSRRYNYISDLYCVADELKLLLQQSRDFNIQNRFYSGWIMTTTSQMCLCLLWIFK